MSTAGDESTRASLLQRLREDSGDQDAWNEFVRRYSPQIESWCRRWRLNETDVEEVTQLVLVKLVAKMRTFSYDPSRTFRGWLRVITQHVWYDLVHDERREALAAGTGDSRVLEQLEKIEAREDLEVRLERAYDLELLEGARARVQQRVEPQTWEAFRLTTDDGLSGAEAAARLGMQVGAVFKARSNVRKLLQEEIQKLESVEP